MTLRTQEWRALVEATRRRTRFIDDPTGGSAITQHWTGLGTLSEYKQALERGFMEPVSKPNPRCMAWWRLTDKGARVVAYWIGAGYDYKQIETSGLPPMVIPDAVIL